MHEPGMMSALLHLAEEAGRLPVKPVMSSGVFIMISRHLSSCICNSLILFEQSVRKAECKYTACQL